MPGLRPRTRHAASAPAAPPDVVGEGTGRRVRDVPHRRSRKGRNQRMQKVSRQENGAGQDGKPFMGRLGNKSGNGCFGFSYKDFLVMECEDRS